MTDHDTYIAPSAIAAHADEIADTGLQASPFHQYV